MRASRLVIVGLVLLFFVISAASESLAGMQQYSATWTAESFGNDKAGIGTEESQYFEILGIPQGIRCHPTAPLCTISSTPVTTLGPGTAWAPLGPGCRPLLSGEMPRPAKGGTETPGSGTCPGLPYTSGNAPCNKKPPLYRNAAFFTPGGTNPYNAACAAENTVSGANATTYLPPGDTKRGKAMNGNPLTGFASATTTLTGHGFMFPAAPEAVWQVGDGAPGPGFRRTTVGSFIGEGPYLYSYTYAELRNDAGSFGPGKGFFSVGAATTELNFINKVGVNTVAQITVKDGDNRFGGVMKLLGHYKTKVCYFYGGGCALGYGTWVYEDVGAAGYKDSKVGSPVVTESYTTNFSFTYYNTNLNTVAKYLLVAQRFPWTTGTVTVTATGRGPNNTVEQRKGYDNRTSTSGMGQVQLVSPILTQWLAQTGNAPKFETGGIAILKIHFVPEPGVLAGLVAGLSLLAVLKRFRS